MPGWVLKGVTQVMVTVLSITVGTPLGKHLIETYILALGKSTRQVSLL